MQPLVTICIPTYNGAKYLRECLDSVIAQTFTDFELLLVDDQSSDETLSIAQEYAAKDSRICVKQNERNLGLVGNWNRCIELAQGEWIKFVFQDDLIAPECLEKMLAASKPDSSIICCRRNFIFADGTLEETKQYYLTHLSLEKLFPNLVEISAEDYCKATLEHIGVNFVGEPTTVMLHRSVFYKFGVFNPHLIMICDIEYWARVTSHTGITYVPETLATFRVHGKATSAVNYTSRNYRGWVLDGIVLLHDFAFHPIYAPLRDVSRQYHSEINLQKKFQDAALNAWKIAKDSGVKSVVAQQKLLEEWNEVLYFYPFIKIGIERNYRKLMSFAFFGNFFQLKALKKII